MIKKLLLAILLLVVLCEQAWATKYYENTFESYSCDAVNPESWYYELGIAPTIKCDDTPPNGSKYLEYDNPSSQNGNFTEIRYTTVNVPNGTVLYSGVFFKLQRKSGNDIFHEGNLQSYNKLIDLFWGSGIYYSLCVGQQENWGCNWAANTNSKFTTWIMKGSPYPDIACFDGHTVQNASGYSGPSPLQLDYDRWHSVTLQITFHNSGSGVLKLWVDGTLIEDYSSVANTSGSSSTTNSLLLSNTIAQPGYDAPAHYIRFDYLLVTDSWSDIVAAGLDKDPEASTSVPTAQGVSGSGFSFR